MSLSGDRVAAIASLQRTLELDPEFAMARAQLGFQYSGTGQFAQSAQSATLIDSVGREAQRVVDTCAWQLHSSGSVGVGQERQLALARRASSRAIDVARQEKEVDAAAACQAARGVREAAYGDAAEAKRTATAALDASRGRESSTSPLSRGRWRETPRDLRG